MEKEKAHDILESGTGFMANLTDSIRIYEDRGYTENLVLKYDHFEAQSGKILIRPEEFKVDKVVRFENTSDPDDQSILYLISVPAKNIRGLYVESYGPSSDGLSPEMLNKFKNHFH